jgi:ABC-type polysaccharide/polyol phosphate export permease
MSKSSFYKKVSLAFDDIVLGVKFTPAWLWLSWSDIQQRYKRSVLGPLWITLSLAVTVCFMGLLYSKILKIEIKEYIPFLTAGLINWALISTIILEGSTIFSSNEGLIKQVRLPFSFYIFRMLSRNIIIWLHNIVVLILVKIIFMVPIDFNILWLFISLPLVCVFGFGLSLLLGILTVRYRDLQQVMNSLVQLLFFVTPVIWMTKFIGNKMWVLKYNVFYYFMELLRQPFTGTNILSNGILGMAVLFTVGISIVSFVIFSIYRPKIAYWI